MFFRGPLRRPIHQSSEKRSSRRDPHPVWSQRWVDPGLLRLQPGQCSHHFPGTRAGWRHRDDWVAACSQEEDRQQEDCGVTWPFHGTIYLRGESCQQWGNLHNTSLQRHATGECDTYMDTYTHTLVLSCCVAAIKMVMSVWAARTNTVRLWCFSFLILSAYNCVQLGHL